MRERVHFLPPDFIKRRFTGLSLEDHCCQGFGTERPMGEPGHENWDVWAHHMCMSKCDGVPRLLGELFIIQCPPRLICVVKHERRVPLMRAARQIILIGHSTWD